MNSGAPKLLVIPTPSASLEGGDTADTQEDEEWSRRQKTTLRMRLVQLASMVWVALSAILGWLRTLPSYWRMLKNYCAQKLSRRVQPDTEEGSESSRVLTPVIRLGSESPLAA